MTQAEYQLFLARQGSPREPKPTRGVEVEAELHSQILEECRRRGWKALHGSMVHRTHRTPGEPDFVVLADQGRVLFIECKTKDGKLSMEQRQLRAHANKLGHEVHVVRSLDEFLRIAAPTAVYDSPGNR
jgi:hypothetical protein